MVFLIFENYTKEGENKNLNIKIVKRTKFKICLIQINKYDA